MCQSSHNPIHPVHQSTDPPSNSWQDTAAPIQQQPDCEIGLPFPDDVPCLSHRHTPPASVVHTAACACKNPGHQSQASGLGAMSTSHSTGRSDILLPHCSPAWLLSCCVLVRTVYVQTRSTCKHTAWQEPNWSIQTTWVPQPRSPSPEHTQTTKKHRYSKPRHARSSDGNQCALPKPVSLNPASCHTFHTWSTPTGEMQGTDAESNTPSTAVTLVAVQHAFCHTQP